MEDIISKLLVANNKTIQEGTKELKDAFKKPEAIPALCDVLVTSLHPQIRQSAAVLLRRKLGKKRQWSKLNMEIRNRIKQGMLQALVNEQEKLVKNSIAQFIGIIGKHEFPENSWPEVLQFVHTLTSSGAIIDKETLGHQLVKHCRLETALKWMERQPECDHLQLLTAAIATWLPKTVEDRKTAIDGDV
ncbi:hypothetical protein JTB14_030951 [Gonioctena quinquepunctata]|nr:hypothetical protein JTB14_030951 [Gonioctena quinquepunctata]